MIPTKPDPAAGDNQPRDANDESTGLPGLRTWRAVYWVVIGIFAIWVVLLTVLTKAYS